MKRYLRLISDPTKFNNAADYPGEEPPFKAPEGFEWVDGEPEGLSVYSTALLPQQLDTLFMNLSVEVRAQFYPLKAAVKLALEQGDSLGALAIIQGVAVPEELESVKDSMLTLFT